MPSTPPAPPSAPDTGLVVHPGQRPGVVRRLLLGWPAKVVVSAGLVAWLVATVEWAGVARTLQRADRTLVALALLPLAAVVLLAAERWRNAALACAVDRPRRFFVRASFTSQFAGQFLPAAVGTDAVRLALLWRADVPLRGSFQCVLIDRLCGLAALVTVMLAGLPFAFDRLPAQAGGPIAIGVALTGIGGLALLFADRLPLPAALQSAWLRRLLALVADTRSALASARVAWALALSVALHVLSIAAVLIIARALGYPLGLLQLLSVTALAIFAAMLPVSFNGWGVREGALVIGLGLLGVPRDAALMTSLLYGIGGAVCSLPGSVLWIRLRPSLRRAAPESS